jgi:SAM-dependent methyltransferase
MLTRENALTFWETRYHDQHTPWDRGAVSPALTMWLTDGTLARCSILVPGCGHGYEVVELARRGFAVTAVDIAPAPCAVLRAALRDASLAATVLEADLLDWHPPPSGLRQSTNRPACAPWLLTCGRGMPNKCTRGCVPAAGYSRVSCKPAGPADRRLTARWRSCADFFRAKNGDGRKQPRLKSRIRRGFTSSPSF